MKNFSRRHFLKGSTAVFLGSGCPITTASPTTRRFKINGNMVIPPDVYEPLDQETKTLFRKTELSAFKLSLGGSKGTYQHCLDVLDYLQTVYLANPDVFMHINSPMDLNKAYDSNKIGIIYSFEAATMFEGKVDRIREFADLGVRIMQPGYNNSNVFGAGVLSTKQPLGLTETGRQAIETMQACNVLVDLSHAHEETADDVLQIAKRPVAMTHTGCRSINQHPRNKSDKLLKKTADNGGVVGIYEMSYLTPDLNQQSLPAFMKHVVHALNVCGEDHVGIGSDTPILGFDTSEASLAEWNKINQHRKETGVAAPGEGPPPYVVGMNGPHKMEVFEDELKKHGLSSSAIDKLLGQNFARVFSESWSPTRA